MDSLISDISAWMLEDGFKIKAKLKYELKQQELSLRPLIHESIVLNDCAHLRQTLETLIVSYNAYFTCINGSANQGGIIPSVSTLAAAIELYQRIQPLVQEILFDGVIENELVYIIQILDAYRAITAFVSSMGSCSELSGAISLELQNLLQALEPSLHKDWTLQFMIYAQTGIKTANHSNELFLLPSEMLQRLSQIYLSDSGVQLFNALYYYRYQPQHLLTGSLTDLVGLRAHQLVLLHDFCLGFREQLKVALRLKGQGGFVDYVLHEPASLLSGVRIYESDSIRNILLTALNHCGDATAIQPAAKAATLSQMIFAFKYQFNPQNLLEQLILTLKQWEEQCVLMPKDYSYQAYLLAEAKSLATDSCCELYGFLTNKDMRYLLQLLQKASEGHVLPGLPVIVNEARVLIKDVRDKLLELIHTLQLVLTQRHLSVLQFVEQNEQDDMSIGLQNKEALLWLISLVDDESARCQNTKLDNIFSLLDTSYPDGESIKNRGI